MLEKTEGATKNEQPRETGSIRYTRHRPVTNKTKNTTQYVLDITFRKQIQNDLPNETMQDFDYWSYIFIVYVAESSRAMDIRLNDWCCSVSKVCVRITSSELKDFILTLLGLMFRRIYTYNVGLSFYFIYIY
jgi:hypothetical protein